MQITLRNAETNTRTSLVLPDERRALFNFLSFVDGAAIDAIEIADMPDDKLPRNIQRLSRLKALTLVRCHALTGLPAELAKCPLKELAFIKCADFHDLTGIRKCPGLEVLHISGCDAFSSLPEELADLTMLRALDLSYSESIQWIDLSILPKSLKILDMHGCWQADFDADALAGLHIASLQIQDTVHLPELLDAPAMPELEIQLRHILTTRDGCGLDA
ncbi:MAG: hypothetical protein IKY83_09840 [Proteobacteria bacterium]|nr:hypothetical protein [Pseudomonadota bacterium]